MTRDEFDELLSQHGLACIGETTWQIAQLLIAHEREACAQVCDVIAEKDDWEGTADVCAKAIRARGNNETE